MIHPKTQSILLSLALLALAAVTLTAAVPRGWKLDYDVLIDDDVDYRRAPTILLRSTNSDTDGCGTVMQQFRADNYRAKRLRFSGSLKTDDVKGWVGLWMRVNADNLVVAFDNMQNRAIRGTHSSHDYDVVLDISPNATHISFGFPTARAALGSAILKSNSSLRACPRRLCPWLLVKRKASSPACPINPSTSTSLRSPLLLAPEPLHLFPLPHCGILSF